MNISKNYGVQKVMFQKIMGFKKLCFKKLWVSKIYVSKNYGFQKVTVQKIMRVLFCIQKSENTMDSGSQPHEAIQVHESPHEAGSGFP